MITPILDVCARVDCFHNNDLPTSVAKDDLVMLELETEQPFLLVDTYDIPVKLFQLFQCVKLAFPVCLHLRWQDISAAVSLT